MSLASIVISEESPANLILETVLSTGWEIGWMRKLDLSVEKQHLLDNQRLKIPVSGVFRQNNGIYFHSRAYLSLPARIILTAALCDAGNLIIFS